MLCVYNSTIARAAASCVETVLKSRRKIKKLKIDCSDELMRGSLLSGRESPRRGAIAICEGAVCLLEAPAIYDHVPAELRVRVRHTSMPPYTS